MVATRQSHQDHQFWISDVEGGLQELCVKLRSQCDKAHAGGAGGISGRAGDGAALNPAGAEQTAQPNPEPRAPRRPGEQVWRLLTPGSQEHSWGTR